MDLNDSLNKIKGVALRIEGAEIIMIFEDFNIETQAFATKGNGSQGNEYHYHHSEHIEDFNQIHKNKTRLEKGYLNYFITRNKAKMHFAIRSPI